jgi:hypothetical protein
MFSRCLRQRPGERPCRPVDGLDVRVHVLLPAHAPEEAAPARAPAHLPAGRERVVVHVRVEAEAVEQCGQQVGEPNRPVPAHAARDEEARGNNLSSTCVTIISVVQRDRNHMFSETQALTDTIKLTCGLNRRHAQTNPRVACYQKDCMLATLRPRHRGSAHPAPASSPEGKP